MTPSIESGVSVPVSYITPETFDYTNQFPSKDFAVGDSVFLPGADPRLLKQTIQQTGHAFGYTFLMLPVVESSVWGFRVWRTA
nr:hypothetical protein Hi04_10k_c2220_00021 [uncultured bacterium]